MESLHRTIVATRESYDKYLSCRYESEEYNDGEFIPRLTKFHRGLEGPRQWQTVEEIIESRCIRAG